ncbi:1,2-diacylglycerol-3-alpha-glucose alpha-1,2-galactosyltransferase [Weissella uvarum]|uniref:glycosyltransferase family 4 protein n=1 Tax=Weissella uvarum TaxID=1479233 RepID=UPI00195FE4EF|nr:glycosyltransferase family 4 protein [Weissella uvarum]MBM7618022.1 1,2-diacylglycerol-3-alpha-glucose alpha-1,2-galactosyltransferase [Weissella uvarum]MCM0596241.1 glycosyltransferase family 4 protein [Weissella uvarum]
MIKITMFSAAESVPGQGVGSAYRELVNLLEEKFPEKFPLKFNKYSKTDISHYHTINPTFFLSTFLPGRGRKIGYVHFLPETLEDSIKLPKPIKRLFYWYVMTFYKRMDHLVVVNPTFIDKLVDLGVKRDKVTYIPNFVSKDTFYPMSNDQKRAWREKFGIDQDAFVILGVGQVQERKGVWDFIELARQNPQWQFVWTGGFSFGAMTAGYEDLKKVVDNPPANLSFPGIVDRSEMNAYYNVADVFLLPSYTELFPMSALEAFSTGTPTVLRDLDLYKAIIEGYYLPAKNREEMQTKLEQINEDDALKEKLSQDALAASDRYSADNVAKLWEKFYTEQAEVK